MVKQKLRYKDLQLGERALELYRATQRKDFDSIEREYGSEARRAAESGLDSVRKWNMDNLPTFLNRREVYRTKDGTVLTTTDLIIAGVTGGVNKFLMSDAGTGKSQVIADISNTYFNGDLRNGGNSIVQTANNDFRIASIMERRNPEKPTEIELSGAHQACFIGIDELTRAHPIVANEFSDLGNGVYHRGNFNVRLGKEGYFLVIATGNDPRKKENRGAMEWDGSMLNRFPIALDLGSDRFGIAGTEDEVLKTKIKPSTTGVLYCKPKDLTEKIINAYNQILESSSDLGTEAEAVFYYLSLGANICPGKNGDKNLSMRKKSLLPQWPKTCVDCSKAKSGGKHSLCRLVNTENGRTLSNARRYVAALDYLLKLKAKDSGREIDYNLKDLAFLAFELCGTLQEGVLDSGILQSQYYGSNERMMADVITMLKEDFGQNEDMFIAELEGIKHLAGNYSLVKDKKSGMIYVISKTEDSSELKDGFEIVNPLYKTDGTISWNFAPKVIQQLKDEEK